MCLPRDHPSDWGPSLLPVLDVYQQAESRSVIGLSIIQLSRSTSSRHDRKRRWSIGVLSASLIIIVLVGILVAMSPRLKGSKSVSEDLEARSESPAGSGLASATAPGESQPVLDPTPATESPRTRTLQGGQLLQRSFQSAALQRQMPYYIYLPPGYQSSDARYPVLYMLHGYYGSFMEWADIGIHQAADEMIQAQEIEPMIVVLVEGETSYFVNHGDAGPRWGDYVERDVVAIIDDTYRTIPTREARAVGGLSMGGQGALRMAFQHPEIFGIVGAHSPTVRWERPDEKFEFADDAYYDSINPLQLARVAPNLDQLQIWIDVGDDDWNWFWVADLHTELEARAIPHEFTYFPGPHEGEYWIAHQKAYLDYYSRAFRTARALDAARRTQTRP